MRLHWTYLTKDRLDDIQLPRSCALPIFSWDDPHLKYQVDHSQSSADPRRRFEFVQMVADNFWKKWIRDYFPSLLIKQKWHIAHRNLKVGDIVLIQDSSQKSMGTGKSIKHIRRVRRQIDCKTVVFGRFIWTHRRLPSLVFAKNTTVLQSRRQSTQSSSTV